MFITHKKHKLAVEEALAERLESANIDTKPIIADQDSLERLMVFMEKHFIDEVTIGNVTVRKSVHLLPEDDKKKKPTQDELLDIMNS